MKLRELVNEMAAQQRSGLERKIKKFGLVSFDSAHAALIAIATDFDRRRDEIRASPLLTAAGKSAALEAAARAAELALRAIETGDQAKGLDAHIDALKREVFTPPPHTDDDDALPTRGQLHRELNRMWIAQAIFQQVAALDLHDREILARTTTDADVARILETGPPIVRAAERDGQRFARVEPLIPNAVRTDVQRQRAKADNPEAAAKLDELEQLRETTTFLVNHTREQIGLTFRRDAESADGHIRTEVSGADSLAATLDPPAAFAVK